MKPPIDYKNKLPKSFYTRNTLIVAKDLLGKILVKKQSGKILAGKIVEVEAYDGKMDQAAHTFIGKTQRNKIMFESGGYFYVYFTYGVHYCCNVVTGLQGEGTAVLIRALEPLEGVDIMIKNRYGRNLNNDKEFINLSNGPAKLCKAFSITSEHNEIDLTGSLIYILDAPKISNKNIVTTTRIGISKSKNLPWRFYIKNNPFVSKK